MICRQSVVISLRAWIHKNNDTAQHDEKIEKKKKRTEIPVPHLCAIFFRWIFCAVVASPLSSIHLSDHLKKLNALKPASLYYRVALFRHQRLDLEVRIQVPK